MRIIIAHDGTDFDGLAAMIAATKIYSGARPVFPGLLSNQVKDFMALFKDQFQVLRVKDVDFEAVQEIILVDTKDPARVGPFKELLFKDSIRKVVYDHHLLDQFEFQFEDHTSAVGSTTTLLVQKIQEAEIPITPTEATLFALGIYHDTGCLTYGTTTALDAEMVAFLLRSGARLSVVEEFVELALNEAQQEVLNLLLDNMEHVIISGLRVDLYFAILPEYLLGVNNIVHKLREIREADLYFVIVEMDRRVLVVGRSDCETVNLAHFFAEMGGGGHPGAASAMLKGATLDEVKVRVYQLLQDKINLPRMAKDIMTSPVKTVPPEATIQQVEEIMLRYGHSGLVVMDEKGIKGVFSRRDLDKVKKAELADLPVKGYMTRKVVTVSPQAPISEVQRLMVTHDIGRLPVVDEEGQLLGLITRTDLLRVLYGEDISVRQNYYGGSLVTVDPKRYNIQHRLVQSSPAMYDLFCQIRDLSERLGMRPYLVGGFVRDLFIKSSNHDLDLVVEGDGVRFACELHKLVKGKLETHSEFGTAHLEFDGFGLDIATARVEYYEYPAALPHVEPGLLKQDLYRRDFTINTLAISLAKDNFGWFLDFFGGRDDLKKGLIRGLHSFTFIDDPTRILRGIKFAVRFGFRFEDDTDNLVKQAVTHGVFRELKGPRLWEELRHLLMEKQEIHVMRYLEEYGILPELIPGLQLSDLQWEQLKRVEQVLQLLENSGKDAVQRWLLVLMILFAEVPTGVMETVTTSWNFSSECRGRLHFAQKEVFKVKESLSRTKLKDSQVFGLLESLRREELLYLLLISDSQLIVDRILDFHQRLQWIELDITGKDIIGLGFPPGPLFKEAIAEVKKAKLDGEVKTRLEELEYIRRYFMKKVGGHGDV